jgi:hypothetical protein
LLLDWDSGEIIPSVREKWLDYDAFALLDMYSRLQRSLAFVSEKMN